MRRVEPLRLMQLHDGELPKVEAAELARLLAGDPDARAALAGLDQLGDFLRRYADERSAGVGDLASDVMARLDEDPARVSGWRQHRPARLTGGRRWVWGAAGALAAAAALTLLFVARRPGAPAADAARLAALGSAARSAAAQPGPARGVLAAAPREPSEPGVSIEAVDFGPRNGTIFMVPVGGEATTPVVWVVDPPATSGGEARSL
ncbi:MAG TPA: hypothetical protein PLU22_09295 [Polyangiaceae bacterium]|nr:hypothetical protein [Polyangiaceae bacterium]